MKSFLFVLFLALPLSSHATSTFKYDLNIQNDTYYLTVEESFPATSPFASVVANLRNGELFKAFDPSITQMIRSNETEKAYQLTMEVTQYKVSKTTSAFDCGESWSEHVWTRNCDLLTKVKQGGKFMRWKKETSECQENQKTQETFCTLQYQGQMKDIVVAGITLMKAPPFAVKAKVQALDHFAKIWIYSLDKGYSTVQTIDTYSTTDLAAEIKNLETEGKKQAKAEGAQFKFHRQYSTSIN